MDLASCELSSAVGLLGLCLWFPTIYAHGDWSNWYVVELCKPNNTPAASCALSCLALTAAHWCLFFIPSQSGRQTALLPPLLSHPSQTMPPSPNTDQQNPGANLTDHNS